MICDIKGGMVHMRGKLIRKHSAHGSALKRNSDLKVLKSVLAGVHISNTPVKKRLTKRIAF